MKSGSDRHSAGTTERRVGNLYERLQQAREQRAKILATPKPANSPEPTSAVEPATKKVVPSRVRPENKAPGRERLPPLRPAPQETMAEPLPKLRRPVRRSRWLLRHAILVAVLLTGILAMNQLSSETGPLAVNAPDTIDPPVADQSATLPSNVDLPLRPAVRSLEPITADANPTAQDTNLTPAIDAQIDAQIVDPVSIVDGPRPKPRADASVDRLSPSGLQIDSPVSDAFDALFSESAPPATETLSLRPAINLHSSVSAQTEANVRQQIEALGLDWTDPIYFDFNVNTTQVRYFHDADRAEASTLADAVGATVRDFTSFVPQPPAGRVEVWIAGRSDATQSSSETWVLDDVRQDLRQFGTDLRGALRSITGNR